VSLVLASVQGVKNLSAQQWTTAAELASTLRPFLEVTALMSGAAYPTISMIVPVIDGLQHLLSNTTGGLDVLRGIFSRLVQEKFSDVFEDDQLCVATVVDPRFKLGPFDSADRRHRAVEATWTPQQRRRRPPLTPTHQQSHSSRRRCRCHCGRNSTVSHLLRVQIARLRRRCAENWTCTLMFHRYRGRTVRSRGGQRAKQRIRQWQQSRDVCWPFQQHPSPANACSRKLETL